MLLAGLVGVPIGTYVLPFIPLQAFKIAIGIVLIGYCLFMLFLSGRLRLQAGGLRTEVAIGFGGGVLAGIAGLSGVLPTIYASLKAWPKDQRRVFFQIFNSTILAAMLAATAVQRLMGMRFLLALAVAAPGIIVGSWTGVRLYKRLDDVRFERVVLFVLLISGIGLVWSSR
jgi:uncharacterized membrane protein YfcA